jgi:hypothetical protein
MFNSYPKPARTVATIGVAAALAVGGVAVAQSGNDNGNGNRHGGKPHAGKRMPPPPGGPIGGPLSKDLTYAELHVQKNGQAEVVRMDRGKVASAGDTSITVTENDGNEVTIPVDDNTKVLAGPGRKTSVTDLKTGQQVIVCGPEGGTAKAILVPPKRGKMPRGPQSGPQGSSRQGGPQGQLPPPPGAQMRG